jgi:hypothetical protein
MVYAIAMFSITDRAVYGRYQAQFMGVMNRYKERCSRRMSIRWLWKATGTGIRW